MLSWCHSGGSAASPCMTNSSPERAACPCAMRKTKASRVARPRSQAREPLRGNPSMTGGAERRTRMIERRSGGAVAFAASAAKTRERSQKTWLGSG
eukprot:scaffold107702_cov34-Tisochrysis_lutea.AAC.3